jgi:hypothetical protein
VSNPAFTAYRFLVLKADMIKNEGKKRARWSFPLTTGSPGKRIDLALRDGEYPDWLSPGQFFFKMKNDCLTDISHQLIECLALGEYINPYPPATPESAIRIDFKFDEHGHPLSPIILRRKYFSLVDCGNYECDRLYGIYHVSHQILILVMRENY